MRSCRNRASILARCCLLYLSTAQLALGLQQQPYSISVSAEYVKVPLTVLDDRGKIIANLSREHIEVFEDGRPQQIVNFIFDKDPLDVVLLVDVSSSLRRELKDLKKVAGKFAEAFDHEDRMSLVAFSDESKLALDWTDKKGHVKKAVNSLELGHRTALYDALWISCREVFRPSRRKRAIILLTDGMDNESRVTFEDALAAVVESSVAVYVVSKTRIAQQGIERSDRIAFLARVLRSQTGEDVDFVKQFFEMKEAELERLANNSGGRVFYPLKSSDLQGVYQQVAYELQNQYVLTYRPGAGPSGFRAIQIRYRGSPGRVAHRKGYYAGQLPSNLSARRPRNAVRP